MRTSAGKGPRQARGPHPAQHGVACCLRTSAGPADASRHNHGVGFYQQRLTAGPQISAAHSEQQQARMQGGLLLATTSCAQPSHSPRPLFQTLLSRAGSSPVPYRRTGSDPLCQT